MLWKAVQVISIIYLAPPHVKSWTVKMVETCMHRMNNMDHGTLVTSAIFVNRLGRRFTQIGKIIIHPWIRTHSAVLSDRFTSLWYSETLMMIGMMDEKWMVHATSLIKLTGVCLAKDQKAWKARRVIARTKNKANNARCMNVTTLYEGCLGFLPQKILKNLL